MSHQQALRADLNQLRATSSASCLAGGGYQGPAMSRDVRELHNEGAYSNYHSYVGAYSGRTLQREAASVRGTAMKNGLMVAVLRQNAPKHEAGMLGSRYARSNTGGVGDQ